MRSLGGDSDLEKPLNDIMTTRGRSAVVVEGSFMTPTINPNGRIAGTRTSVYDIVPYLEGGRFTLEEIAKYTAISMEELQVALKYIEENRDEVMLANREIDERHARGNPPEIQAKLDSFSARFGRFRQWLAEQRKAAPGPNGDGQHSPPGAVMQMFREWMDREDELEKQRNNS
jgi:uncharacterized protein (DUF433 family)